MLDCQKLCRRRFAQFSAVGWGAALVAILGMSCLAEAGLAQDDMSRLFQDARQQFKPVTPEQLAQTRGQLAERMHEVERFVRPTSANGQRWLKYLRWEGLKNALASEGPPELEPLDTTLRQLNRDENGLELPRFRRLADALQRYRNLAAVSQWQNPVELYGQQLDALERSLNTYRQEPTPANEAAVSQRLRILVELGQAPELVHAIRRQFAQPNAYISLSSALIAAGARPINRVEAITDNILGTRIRGDAHTTGTVGVATIPSGDRAVLEFISQGHSRSENVGNNGPAVICSTGHTNFTATKRVEITDSSFTSFPASVDATTHSDIHSISKRGGGLGSRIVSNVGWQRARESHGRADAVASDHAEDRIARQFNDEVADKLRDARRRYEEEYRRPLLRRGELPEYTRFTTDRDSVLIESTQATGGQLAASGAPPQPQAGHDVTLRLHQSAVNNYAASLLGGATASETRPGQETEFDVKLPKWMKDVWEKRETKPADGAAASDEPFKAWSMTFRERPISVEFQGETVKLTTHFARLTSGDQTFANWDITGTYKPELVNGGVILRREGELVVLPADFRGSLTSRQTAERSNLEKEINDRSAQGLGFPATIEFDPIELEGALADAGPLEAHQLMIDENWLTLAWDRASKPK